MSWTAHTEFLDDESVLRAELRTQGQTALWGDVVHGWQTDPGMTEVFMGVLAEAPFDAFFFETPAVSRDTLDRAFEFVLIDCPSLAGVAPEPWIFEEHFGSDQDTDGVATFPNIGADALLVTPYPARPPRNYAHLAAFTRQAPREQQLALWHAVGEAARQWFRGSGPVWISTSGLEVFWLHVRLDSYPKYYNHAAYRHGGPG